MNPMQAKTDSVTNTLLRLASIALVAGLLLSFVFQPASAWLSLILATWFIGTQRPARGLALLILIDFIPRLLSHWGQFTPNVPIYLLWMAAATGLSIFPLALHRLVSPRLPGVFSTLPLALAGSVCQALGQAVLPAEVFNLISLARTQTGNPPILQIGAVLGSSAIVFLMYWFAALLNWMWDYDFQPAKIAWGARLAGVVYGAALGYGALALAMSSPLPTELPSGSGLVWAGLVAGTGLSAWAFLRHGKVQRAWQEKPEVVALLRSPVSGAPLKVATEGHQEALVSKAGEKFPIRNGIPTLLRTEEFTGSNKQYNQLYEMIGGFYDSTQKFVAALIYGGMDHIFLSYLYPLEIKPGDLVLETSVGTGLNYKYLPRGVKLFGLDLSPEMLVNCQANLQRWELEAELFHGNAENLPFVDNSFDVVYHVGGINFFTDKARAIREMIRVAKPGSLILIADEMEKHVQDTYERMPITSRFFKNRSEAVSVPVDLIPPEMQAICQEIVWNGRFYLLTFRKPAQAR
jgi:ubiquinone/menaquinone biosynthesis C-methylase UbiE